MMDGDEYYEMTTQQALWTAIEKVREALRACDDGRNAQCWPLGSFGGKDADISSEGCTGMKAIDDAEETEDGWLLRVVIGGHKTCDEWVESYEEILSIPFTLEAEAGEVAETIITMAMGASRKG